MKIDIMLICGKKTVTRDDGRVINQMLLENWDRDDQIQIDFGHLMIASVSFIDEAFGRLAQCYTGAELKRKLVFENMVQYDRKLLNDVITSRLRQQTIQSREACRVASGAKGA